MSINTKFRTITEYMEAGSLAGIQPYWLAFCWAKNLEWGSPDIMNHEFSEWITQKHRKFMDEEQFAPWSRDYVPHFILFINKEAEVEHGAV